MRAVPLRRIVIAGGGLAAARAAERLAERGFTGRVDIVGAEPRMPYRRPELSEGVLTGALRARALEVRVPVPRLTRWLTGERAVGLDRASGHMELASGRRLPYDGLIVATGVRPRRLPELDAAGGRRVHVVRTLDDALRLKAAMRGMRRAIVVGGGLIGTEVAGSLASRGVRVALVHHGAELLGSVVGPEAGRALGALHERRGVALHLGCSVAGLESGARGLRAELSDGTVLVADAVVVAIGSEPEVEWLVGAGLQTGGGLQCDASLYAAGTGDDIVAAGDCAAWPNERFGTPARRVEQWVVTTLAARHAADALLGGRDAAPAFTPVPWGWSLQWGVRVHMVGLPHARLEPIRFDGDPQALRGAFSLHDSAGRITAGVSLDRPGATRRLAELVHAAWPVPGDRVQQTPGRRAAGVTVSPKPRKLVRSRGSSTGAQPPAVAS